MKESIFVTLQKCTVFEGFTSEEIREALSMVSYRMVELAARETYVLAGMPCRYADIIVEGEMIARMSGLSGKQAQIERHELLLSEGIVNRFVTCHPADSEDSDCHVVNLVWLPELQKWAMLDSDMNAWAEDEKGTPLSLAEMRERYIDGREIVYRPLLNSDNDFVYYRAYWAKNLYWFDTWETTGYGREDNNPAYRNNNRHIVLVPSGFKGFELPDHSVLTTDTSRFWAAPQN